MVEGSVGGGVVGGAVTVVRPSEVLVAIRVVDACGWVVCTGMVIGAAAGGGAPTSLDASSAAPAVSATTASGTATQTIQRRQRGGAGAAWRLARPAVTILLGEGPDGPSADTMRRFARHAGDFAVAALTEDGHVGARHVLTGPETLTQAEQAHAIGDALGRPVRWERKEAEEQIAGVPDTALDTWASFVETPEIVTSAVEELTGAPARPFDEWARDHVEDFR